MAAVVYPYQELELKSNGEYNMNRHSQRGMTMIGWIIVIAIFGSIVLTGLKILPMYMDFFQVKSIMESVAVDPEIDAHSKKALWAAIGKRLLINSIRDRKKEDFTITFEEGNTIITVDYETRRPYIRELFLGAHFVHTIEFSR